MKTETLSEFLERGGQIKKEKITYNYGKIVWGKSKHDYINAYKIKKANKNKKKT